MKPVLLLDPRVRGDDDQGHGDDEMVLGSSGFPPPLSLGAGSAWE
jgi:hypothetical protein